jgi:hypothetical protein
MTANITTSAIKVSNLEEVNQESVQEYLDRHADSTVYHTMAWRRIFCESFGYQSFFLVAQSPADGRIVGTLPLYLIRSPFSCRLVSVPFRDRGGPLWSSPEAFLALIERTRSLAEQHGAKFCQLKSLKSYPPQLVLAGNLAERWYWINSTIDLQGLNKTILWQKIGQKTRNMIRQAETAHLTFRDGTDSAHGLTVWYKLHLLTQKRLGIPPFPKKFFRHILQELGPSGAVKLFIVEQNNEPLAATLVLLHRQTAIYGYSSSATTAQHLRPNDFLLFNVFNWLLDNDYGEFDLGSDAPGQTGLLFFKKKWLAKQTQIPVYTSGHYLHAISDSSGRAYLPLRRVLGYAPVSLLRVLGNRVTKYFG